MHPARAKWIASFDMEDLIGSILLKGTILGVRLVAVGSLLQWVGLGHGVSADTIQGINVFHFVLESLPRIGSLSGWPMLLIHWGIAVLLFTPYVRVAASIFYFAGVQRSWKHTVFGSLVFVTLTYILFFG